MARQTYTPTMAEYGEYPAKGGGYSAGIHTDPITVTCKADENTTGEIDKRGLSHGTIFNPTASSVTLDYYGAYESGGTVFNLLDQDQIDNNQTIPAGECADLLVEAAGVPFLLLKTSSGQSDLVIVLAR